ncbi:hypothetical protein LX32DRAFT_641214 [Colletotrichum zoysiae]|uniref:Uncharacterized protein n=1 Tax=Colletotrichum zoysiae TaxID=1216348 RepID=A0AAD9LZX0_9PEZI|nr:hypothetical protein LX32DRAFT_641214 [Colletotrichum zoysiae]
MDVVAQPVLSRGGRRCPETSRDSPVDDQAETALAIDAAHWIAGSCQSELKWGGVSLVLCRF